MNRFRAQLFRGLRSEARSGQWRKRSGVRARATHDQSLPAGPLEIRRFGLPGFSSKVEHLAQARSDPQTYRPRILYIRSVLPLDTSTFRPLAQTRSHTKSSPLLTVTSARLKRLSHAPRHDTFPARIVFAFPNQFSASRAARNIRDH